MSRKSRKRLYLLSLGLVATVSLVPVNGVSLAGWLFDAGMTVAQNVLNKPDVKLKLSVERKILQKDSQGKEKVTWEKLPENNAVVQPGDVLRYQITGLNQGNAPAKNLTVTQPVPIGTVYLLESVTLPEVKGAKVTYSIDGGKTFTTQPLVTVTLFDGQEKNQPAPAELYTHIRWNFGELLTPKTSVAATYQVKVR